mgnify:CR=1 FL=1
MNSPNTTIQPANHPQSVGILMKKVAGLLMEGEEILAVAPQTDVARWWILPPDGVVVTSKRLIFLKVGFFSFSFDDFEWRHVQDVHMSSAMSGATFTAEVFTSKSHSAQEASASGTKKVLMSGLHKELTPKLYGVAQAREHALRDEHRQRLLHERQVERQLAVPTFASMAVPGVVALGAAATPATPSQAGGEGPAARLAKLRSLLDSELITADEFNAKKQAIIDKI